ncbi:Spo0E like sporulation regulatory protein [compost metagenome]
MTLCACREGIERLRNMMELTFEKYESFTDPSVLAASQKLDDALVQYRKCPHFDICNTYGTSSCSKEAADKPKTVAKRMVG